nr:immunoglobulin light chain junction region [Macaca mulatta]MOV75373.1 immunoglobulin light chain junction region [Macaca mulatta]MOV75530.1 immunoglobulin light chain junction region [Macaca mulatta]MOV76353.1 immunoglobulin light chain junction region [Macaca mulatta]
CQQGYTYPYTF